jgi:hypothetical protein
MPTVPLSSSPMLAAAGNCNPYSAAGDLYLPFRRLLGMLTGGRREGVGRRRQLLTTNGR